MSETHASQDPAVGGEQRGKPGPLRRFWHWFQNRERDPEFRRWRRRRRAWMAGFLVVAHVVGALTSVHSLMNTRTPQGTIAWVVALNSLPVVAVPAYWMFGRSRFGGYVESRRARDAEVADQFEGLGERYATYVPEEGTRRAGEKLARLPFLGGNEVELLIDGAAGFDSMLAGIDEAEDYVLVEFYIVRDDDLGRRLADRLMAKARQGVDVYLLYDAIGSAGLDDEYLGPLEEAGVRASPFRSNQGVRRSQMNFRNHRKILVVDGEVGWTGGLNVGDEYLGLDPEFGAWRDTHVRVAGPAVAGLQVPFFEDWHWATGDVLELDWQPPAAGRGDAAALVVASGPADRLETASLLMQQVIHQAEERLWLATPYFIPDPGVLAALHLAVLRGVDVRLLVPETTDSRFVQLAHPVYLEDLLETGVPVYLYDDGFMHQKTWLVDDELAGVGTLNLDNRSLRLNFEVVAVVSDAAFAGDMEKMFEADFGRSRRLTLEEVQGRPFWHKVASRASYLASPIQ